MLSRIGVKVISVVFGVTISKIAIHSIQRGKL